MVLLVNGCVRKNSRTLELANAVLEKLPKDVEEIRLYPEETNGLDEKSLCLRDALLKKMHHNYFYSSVNGSLFKYEIILLTSKFQLWKP